jgi:hypothetical protein
MKLYYALLLLCCTSVTLFAQDSNTIKGFVVDTAYTARLINSSVSVLNTKDSTLVNFTRVSSNGAFNIANLKNGKYILLVTYPGYADYVEKFDIDSVNRQKDFGKVNLTLKARLLQDVIIKGTAAAIKIKGDTTEFNAAAFTIQPNSKVEDLLKQLPGIQVDKDGKITAQGQTVNKVLVDGEEFFGDDPTLVTKNIRGDMVDKVQLYDKSSDQAAFTGIDDGQKSKTINIKLKEDKKQGYFGKIDLGRGTDENYEGQGMFNYFKGKQKVSAYGTVGNTGKIGLGWGDSNKYGASGMEFSDDGMMYISSGRDELESFSGNYNGEGIPLARTGGVHYDAKWNKDKESINTNYKIGSLRLEGIKNVQAQTNLPTGVINSISDQNYDNYAFRQKLDAIYEIKLDTSSTLKITVEGTLKNNEANSNYQVNRLNGNDILLNANDRDLNNKTDQKLFRATAFWNKRFRKKGRSVSLNVSGNLDQSDGEGFLKSLENYYNAIGGLDSTNLTDQFKTNRLNSTVLSTNLTYSEPFSKTFAVVLNYGFGLNNAEQERKSFNALSPGQYTQLDTSFSNNYKLDQLSNQVGAIFNYKTDKTVLNFGSKATAVQFDQLNVNTKKNLNRNFINWSPQASYQYKFSQQKSFRVNYNGNTNQPTIAQIQPVRDNTDPLSIIIGNPNLKPSFTNRFNLSYNSYKVLSSRNIYLFANYSFTMNPIVSNTTTDSVGKSTFQFTNLNSKNTSNFYFSAYFGKKIKALDLDVGFNLGANGNDYYNYANNALNQTKSYSYSGALNLSKYKAKKYNMHLRAGPTYNTSESSLQKQRNNNGWGVNGNGFLSLFLPWKFEISSEANYQYTAKTESFNQDFERLTLDATFSKKFLKSEGLRFSISGKDLLNQNTGFNRTAYGNVISQTNYTTIRRFFMGSITWDFSKMGGSKTQK